MGCALNMKYTEIIFLSLPLDGRMNFLQMLLVLEKVLTLKKLFFKLSFRHLKQFSYKIKLFMTQS